MYVRVRPCPVARGTSETDDRTMAVCRVMVREYSALTQTAPTCENDTSSVNTLFQRLQGVTYTGLSIQC